ncbi:MAG: ABC transporter substrate-binding protein [Thermodesulfobacteriota bacterium]
MQLSRAALGYDLLSWVAENKGFWKGQGLEVEWVPFVGGGRLYRAVAAGRINMGVSAAASFFNAEQRVFPLSW